MDEEKRESFWRRNASRCVRCGEVAAALSVLFVIRRRREQRREQEQHHWHFPLVSH